MSVTEQDTEGPTPQEIYLALKARAEKAERERDEWKEAHDHHEKEVERVCAKLSRVKALVADRDFTDDELEAALADSS